jgi:hypothetical protein
MEAVSKAKSKVNRKRTPKSVLKLPDLEQSKSAVLNSLTSPSSQRTYDRAIREFIEWYCSEPRLAFNKTVVTRYRLSLEQRHSASTTINLRLAAVRRLAYEAADCGLLSADLAAVSDRERRKVPRQTKNTLLQNGPLAGVRFVCPSSPVPPRLPLSVTSTLGWPLGNNFAV